MKRLTVWAIVAAFVFMLVSPAQAATADAKIVFNGEELSFDVAPFVEDGRTLVPVRGVFENLGLAVVWDQPTQTATINSEDTTIKMKLGQKKINVNDTVVTLDTAVSIKNNRLFIPVRYVSETGAGANVKWNQASQTVYITTDAYNEEIKAFLTDVSEVEMNSFSTSMDIKQTMDMMGEKITADMVMDMDMVLDPLGLYQAMSMTMEELGGEAMSTESYLTEDGYFVYDSMTDQWVKYDDEMTEELINLSNLQMDPAAQFDMMTDYYQHVQVIEKEDTYVLHTSLAGDEFQSLLEEILNLTDLGLGQDLGGLLEGLEMNINQMDMVSVLDKETLYPISGTMYSDMTIGFEGETMSIVQDVEYSYSNVNELEEIVIPQEVLDSAVPIDELEVDFEEELAVEEELEGE